MPSIPTEERWRRIDSLFQDALDCPETDRQALLDVETAGDPDLRREVEEMLAHAGDASARIARSIGDLAGMAAVGGSWTGRRVGPYRLVREIGRGGMGIVFEASRDDAEYRKTVALKLVPAWRDQPVLRERFRHERQILAGLDHPNIARFQDGGTEEGIPYFVMEYVDGATLSEWRRERKPTLREALDLFRQVCAAVHSAHENLIVHRDLKPANILVTRDGIPKLLDFGIAKLLAPLPEESAATTEFRQWTPDYASPEQVRGGAITTRSDVYSLGLILYELLCGEPGQTADPSSPLALDRSICEAEPPLPSARAADRGDAALQRVLRGDLDTIVAKAISKDPQRRYSSAAALSADLDRYKEGRPVQARPATLLYRMGKLLRRRRLAFGAGALVAATAILGIATTIHQANRAEHRFQQVRALANAFVFDVHDRIQYLPGATEARKAIVSTGLRYLESLRPDAAGDPSLALELAAAYQRIGDVQGHPNLSSLHDTDGAWTSYRAAAGLLSPLFRKDNSQALLPMAEVEYRLGLVAYLKGQAKVSEDSLLRAREIVRTVLGRQPNYVDALKLSSDISSQIARSASDAHLPDQARAAAEETVESARHLAELQPSSVDSLDSLAVAQSTLGAAYRSARQPEDAVRSFRDSAVTREKLVLQHPHNTAYARSLMMSYGHLGDALGPPRNSGLGDLAASSQAYGRAMEIAQSLARQDPADRTARNDLANVFQRAGDILLQQPNRVREALPVLEESERIFMGMLKEDPANERCRFSILFVSRRVAEALEKLGRDSEAAAKLMAVRSLAGTLEGTKDAASARIGYAVSGIYLARIKARAGDPSALALANTTAADLSTVQMRRMGVPWGEALDYRDLGLVFQTLGKKDEAVRWLQKSADTWREMKLPAVLDVQRAAQLAAVESALATARR